MPYVTLRQLGCCHGGVYNFRTQHHARCKSFIVSSNTWIWNIGLVTAADLLWWSWAHGPAPLLKGDHCQLFLLFALDDGAINSSMTNSMTNQVLFELGIGEMSYCSPPGIGSFILELGQSAIGMRTHDCSQTWMIQHWICHFRAGPSAQLSCCWRTVFVSGLRCWDLGPTTPQSFTENQPGRSMITLRLWTCSILVECCSGACDTATLQHST